MLFVVKRAESYRYSRECKRNDDCYRIEAIEQNAEPDKNGKYEHTQSEREPDGISHLLFIFSECALNSQPHEKEISDRGDTAHQISEQDSIVPPADNEINRLHDRTENKRKNAYICSFTEDGFVDFFHDLRFPLPPRRL